MSKSFLKWAGGKSKSISFIEESLPFNIKRFTEPFAGSAVVSLNIAADEYILADYNEDLINVFTFLKQEKSSFIEYCRTFFRTANKEEIYYKNRDRFNSISINIERAALFIYLNRHSFNGLCRYNSSGKFNVPFGRYKTIYFPEREMEVFIKKSDRFQFKCCGFEETFKMCEDGDVYYADPPYIPLNDTAYFTSYTDEVFSFEKQNALVSLAEDSNCLVLISNHWVPGVTEELYKNGNTDRRKYINRSIGAAGDSRKKVEEVLVIYNKHLG